jgi:hypothetical protein
MKLSTHIVGYTALFVLLSAGAAQSLSGSSTVYSDDIVDGQVTYADVRDNAMTGRKILNGSVTGADIAAGSVGLSKLGAVWSDSVSKTITGQLADYVFAPCPAGKTAIGASFEDPSYRATVESSQPLNDGWFVGFYNWSTLASTVNARALCVTK